MTEPDPTVEKDAPRRRDCPDCGDYMFLSVAGIWRHWPRWEGDDMPTECRVPPPAEKDHPWANCQSMQPHRPHDWDWRQDWGPQVTFHYHCPGVANVTIEPVERRPLPPGSGDADE